MYVCILGSLNSAVLWVVLLQGEEQGSPQLFSAILSRPSVSDPLASLSPQTSRQDSSSSVSILWVSYIYIYMYILYKHVCIHI